MPRRFSTGPQSQRAPSSVPAAVALAPQAAVARHLDLERIRQRVDDRDADAVQPARGLVGVAAEFAARMQHRQDDLERRFLGKAGMRIDRDAAAVVAHGDPALGAQFQFDAVAWPGDRLVHRVVERLGGEVMQPAFVGAADIHAGAAAHRLQAFEDLDVLGGVAVGGLAGPCCRKDLPWRDYRALPGAASRMQCVIQTRITI